MTAQTIEVRNNEGARRFEVEVEGSLSLLEYELTGDRVVFTHTRVPDVLEGRGIGTALAQTALQDARARNLTVVPQCWFVRGYIKSNPEYLSLVAPEYQSRLR